MVTMLWSINYWTVFILMWFVIPILQEYLAAGDFTKRERAMRSIRNNVPFLIVYFVAFLVIVIWLAATEAGREALDK